MSLDTPICHIHRHSSSDGWIPARPHHLHALQTFFELEQPYLLNNQDNYTIPVSVPHTDGGFFRGTFRRLDHTFCEYTDEYGQTVGIAIISSGRAGWINRVWLAPF
jgi:hypothetical protein